MNDNQEKNIALYEKRYQNTSIEGTLERLKSLEEFLQDATTTDTSWVGFYKGNFKEKIQDKIIIELGCGDCTNAAVMAALGARVYANDIASSSGKIIEKLNNAYNFKHPLIFVEGDFLENSFPSSFFDFVVGKSFLHHLTVQEEEKFLQETVRLLKPEGEARFFEPAVNNKVLDEIRWYIPVKGRPSKFRKKAFKEWKDNDPHPDRSFSSYHWEKVGNYFFNSVKTVPIGALEKFHRLLPEKANHRKFRKKAFVIEKFLPEFLQRSLARSQVIIYRNPDKAKILDSN